MDQSNQNSEFNQNNQSNGPQFELVETGGWGKRFREWLNRYGSSVILPIVALAILASGIYLYATQKRQETNILLQPDETPVAVINTENSSDMQIDQVSEVSEISTTDEQIIENLVITPDVSETPNIQEIILAVQKNENIITLQAGQGEGVTHLARRAVKDYLNTHNREGLTKEHKIYIEDHIKDSIGSKTLAIGESIEISENLIEEAINLSTKLTTEQLQVIEQFSSLVTAEL